MKKSKKYIIHVDNISSNKFLEFSIETMTFEDAINYAETLKYDDATICIFDDKEKILYSKKINKPKNFLKVSYYDNINHDHNNDHNDDSYA